LLWNYLSKELKPIEIGDVLPSFTLKNEKGEDVDVSKLAAEKGVILFLVPKADTRMFSQFSFCNLLPILDDVAGCTTQACGFRDSYPDFTGVGFDVYCLSADSPSAQTKWQTKVRKIHILICMLINGHRAERATLPIAVRSQASFDHRIGCRQGRKNDEKSLHF
jgi:peroxiredoxin